MITYKAGDVTYFIGDQDHFHDFIMLYNCIEILFNLPDFYVLIQENPFQLYLTL